MNKKILVPVYETFIADMETPISIFQKYVGEELGFLLESKDLKDASKGRYSFISKNPFARLSYLDKDIMVDGKKVETELKFMEYFQEKLRNFEVKNPDKLPFVGGAYGTMAYDIIREFEDIPDNNPDELRVPDSDMFFVKEGVIYDHFHEKITIVVLAEENDMEEAKNRLVEIKKEIFESTVKISFPEKNVGKKPVNANTTRAEYVEMVNKAKLNNINIIMCSILPTNMTFTNANKERNSYIVDVNEKLKRLCEQESLIYIDYYSEFVADGDNCVKDGLTFEGLHPNTKGYNIMMKILKETLLNNGIEF